MFNEDFTNDIITVTEVMGMNEVWKIINIEPTNDVMAIKKAYTSLAHSINPEDEPEKFNELHEAYKTALFLARNGNGNAESEEVSGNDIRQGTDAAEASSEFDFSSIEQERLPDNSIPETIIEDIIEFRECNKLTSRAELNKLSHQFKFELWVHLFAMYRALAYSTNDTSVWQTFFDEPLSRYAMSFSNFRKWLLMQFESDSPHLDVVKKVVSEHENDTQADIIPSDKVSPKIKFKQKQVAFVISIMAFLFSVVFIPLTMTLFEGNKIVNGIGFVLIGLIFITMIITLVIMVKDRNFEEYRKWQ